MMASRRSRLLARDGADRRHLFPLPSWPTSFNVATYELSALRTGKAASVAGIGAGGFGDAHDDGIENVTFIHAPHFAPGQADGHRIVDHDRRRS